ncbi:MAG: glycosyltransferase [Thermoleophilia bacterium]|nr:glycosyltransferase [Thermoleophilia bacterium]
MTATARRLAAPVGRPLARALVRARTRRWPPWSRLLALGDGGGWSVDEDAAHVAAAARRLGYETAPGRWARFVDRQAVFVTSHFEALAPRWLETSHRLGTAYLHGRPGTPGAPEFDLAFEALRQEPRRLERIQVTHQEMHELVLEAGVPEERVFRIPIGIDLERFPLGGREEREQSRRRLGLPQEAFVVGSFQKDGVGWAEGLEPKLVKGPDVLVRALGLLRAEVPELHVLLTGPARGYVRRELERLGVPYVHVELETRSGLAAAYHALDLYLVASRQEGGPKAVLEAMATGTPLVSTRVGQAQELVRDGENGWLVEVEDAEALAACALHVRDGVEERVLAAGRATAEAHAHERLDALWAELLKGFVCHAR